MPVPSMLPPRQQDARALWRSRLADGYDRYSDLAGLDRVFGRWERRIAGRRRASVSSYDPYCEVNLPDRLGFVVATSTGLFACRGSTMRRCAAGRYFGVTIRDGRLYAFEQAGMHGQIVSFDLADLAAAPVLHIWGFNRWIHQIDFLDDELAVVDTLHNRILVYRDVGKEPVHWTRHHRDIAPAGRDRKGRHSPDHRQFNSIHRSAGKIHVVAHNDSVSTGRASEIWVLDERWRVVEVLPTDGYSCHNLVPHEKGRLMNFSLQRSLRLSAAEVYSADGFNRGLAYDGEYVLVGVTPFAEHFADRELSSGFVDVLSNDFRRVGRVVFPRSSVRDLRIIDKDLGLSNSHS